MPRQQEPQFLLSIKDLMKIRGLTRYNTAQKEHQAIRNSISPDQPKRYLTIEEYCEHEALPLEQVLAFLNGETAHPENGLDKVA